MIAADPGQLASVPETELQQLRRPHPPSVHAKRSSGHELMMSKTLVVIAAVLALLVIYQAAQPKGRERVQILFSEIGVWVQKRF
jgi:hypothetical protein